MRDSRLAILGSGISFHDPDQAATYGYQQCDMHAERLPARLRRRTSVATRLAFAAAERACGSAGVDPSMLPAVFTSSLGEIAVTDRLCDDIAHQRFPVSPTQFHNSVHNTASGYWSIAVGSMHPVMAMGGYHDSFALGLLEGFSQLQCGAEQLLLVHYEEPLPAQMLPGNQWIGAAFALVLRRAGTSSSRRLISMPFSEAGSEDANTYASSSPALAALPLFDALRNNRSGKIAVSPEGERNWFVHLEHGDE